MLTAVRRVSSLSTPFAGLLGRSHTIASASVSLLRVPTASLAAAADRAPKKKKKKEGTYPSIGYSNYKQQQQQQQHNIELLNIT
jgi:hypothetical protein